MTTETLLIQRSQVQKLLSIAECIDAVEEVFRLRAIGKAVQPGILGIHAQNGAFHVKAGILNIGANYFVSKTNSNFPNNRKTNDLPTIQGIIVVSNADDGRLLALMDSIELTIIRTGAATAVAAKYLSRKNSQTILVCGCGNQGRISVEAILKVRPIERVYAYDLDEVVAKKFAKSLMGEHPEVEVLPVKTIVDCSKKSDIILTCTTSKKHFLGQQHVSPGTFIAAVGSDNNDKQEVDPLLLKNSIAITDSTDQCAAIGELHHAIDSGVMSKTDVHAELGEVVAKLKEGRRSESDITIFDSTGTGLQDVAAAAIVYEKALKSQPLKLNFAE